VILPLAVAAGVLLAAGAGWWVGVTANRTDLPKYKRITFRRGRMGNARFAPDGHTFVYSADWEGGPSEIYAGRTDSFDDRSLGLGAAEVLAISSSGQLAIRMGSVTVSRFAVRGTLSVVPLAGGEPRPILENVQDADWAAAATELAVIRYLPENQTWRLEYPVGKVLVDGSTWISAPRVSRDRKRVAFFDHRNAVGDDRGAVAVVDLQGNKTILSANWESLQGLAWSPVGNEVWFGGAPEGALHGLHAVTLQGKLRQLASMPADVIVQDVALDGRALAKTVSTHVDIYSGTDGEGERQLQWLDRSVLRDLSEGGKFIVIGEAGEGGGPAHTVYVRPTDGSPAVALGHGGAGPMSPGGRWALSNTLDAPAQFTLLPTGPGDARSLTHDQIDHLEAGWLPDARHVVFLGREPGHATRMYLLDVGSGATRALTPEGVTGASGRIVTSPDGKAVLVLSNDRWAAWPIEGGEPNPLVGLDTTDIPAQWSADGRHLYLGSSKPGENHPRRVYLFDMTTGKRTLWKSLGPSGWTGVTGAAVPFISRDGRRYAYSVDRSISDLYVVSALK
jgi:eukaryotic-like serine/threonine-protein kinase